MKQIEIDEEVFAWLQCKAIPYVDKSPNDTLRRLFGIKTEKLPIGFSKKPKTDLQKLVQKGLLKEGQKLVFKYKGKKLSREYEARVFGKDLLWHGEKYSMSGLTKKILRREGHAIPSEAYRGPNYWYNSDGRSVKDLWAQYLNEFIKEDNHL